MKFKLHEEEMDYFHYLEKRIWRNKGRTSKCSRRIEIIWVRSWGMWNEEVHWSGRFHVCSVDSYWYLIWILYRKLDFNLLLLKVIYCQTRTDLYRGFLRHLKSLSDTCLKIFKNGKTQVPLFLHDVKTHDKNVSLCDNIPNRSQLFLLTLELSLISKTCST